MRHFTNTRGPGPHLNSVQRLRAYLGLTQQDLANLLEVSRPAVALYERDARPLLSGELGRLHALYAVLPAPNGPAPLPEVPTPVLSDDDRKNLDFRRREIVVATFPLEAALARVQVQLAQARLWQQALPTLRTAYPATDETAHDWLRLMEIKATRTLRRASGTPALLQLRLATLQFETAEIERLLGPAAAG